MFKENPNIYPENITLNMVIKYIFIIEANINNFSVK